MVFSSITFLFLFLPVALALYLAAPARFRNGLLFAVSLVFYAWGEGHLVLVMLGSTAISYASALVMAWERAGPHGELPSLQIGGARTRTQKLALVVSIATSLSVLGFYKYFNFGVDNYNLLVEGLGLEAWELREIAHIALPLGISFYTFQSMSYAIDVYLGKVSATRRFIDFGCYVTMFPQLVAGPIVRYRDVAKQLTRRVISAPDFAYGIKRFVIGLAKKLLVANAIAVPADAIFDLPASELSVPVAWLGVVCYALQIYFDFSGYSDMAIGMGKMLGFQFPENFNYPYVSTSIQEFWRRWHISLSSWFRDYLYIPLGGNRASTFRVYGNLFTVFVLCGFWHGAAWNFVFWGFFHGVLLAVERPAAVQRLLVRVWRPARHAYVFAMILVGWVFFRAESLGHAAEYLRAMVLGTTVQNTQAVSVYVDPTVAMALVLGVVGSGPIAGFIREWLERRRGRFAGGLRLAESVLVLAVLLVCAMSLSAGTHNPFIYFRF